MSRPARPAHSRPQQHHVCCCCVNKECQHCALLLCEQTVPALCVAGLTAPSWPQLPAEHPPLTGRPAATPNLDAACSRTHTHIHIMLALHSSCQHISLCPLPHPHTWIDGVCAWQEAGTRPRIFSPQGSSRGTQGLRVESTRLRHPCHAPYQQAGAFGLWKDSREQHRPPTQLQAHHRARHLHATGHGAALPATGRTGCSRAEHSTAWVRANTPSRTLQGHQTLLVVVQSLLLAAHLGSKTCPSQTTRHAASCLKEDSIS